MSKASGTLIVGGGVAGSGLALALARAGHAVTVLEKSGAPRHKVCGEFLSAEAMHYLRALGVDAAAMGAVPISRVRLALRGRCAEAALPFPACSLTRNALDAALLRQAEDAGAQVLRGHGVVALNRTTSGWSAQMNDGGVVRGQEAVLATGKHDLRGWLRPRTRHPEMVAFKMLYRLDPRQKEELGDAVELIVFPGGYAGLQPVEGGAANLSLVIRAKHLQRTGARWSAVVQHILAHSEHLERRLDGAAEMFGKPLTASGIRYGHLQRSAADSLWRVGDQAAVIPSFCGDGISIALHSAALAARCLLDGRSAQEYQCLLYRQLAPRLHGATLLSRLLVAWPQVARLAVAWPVLLTRISMLTRIPDGALIGEVPGADTTLLSAAAGARGW